MRQGRVLRLNAIHLLLEARAGRLRPCLGSNKHSPREYSISIWCFLDSMGGGALCQHIHCRSITGGLRSSASNLMNDALSQQRARFDESASLPWFQQAFSQRILDFYLVLS